jgi:hypothetical protein
MNTTGNAVLIILVVVGIAAVALILLMRNRSNKLRTRFGPEYDRAVKETGSKYRAEAKLEKLQKRVQSFSIRPLQPADRDAFQQSWRAVQAKFVDDPKLALTEADELLTRLMSARGYPMGEFDQRAEELSVDHPVVVENYRAGHDIALRHARGQASTEDMRQAMIHYRQLFEELVGESQMARSRGAGA